MKHKIFLYGYKSLLLFILILCLGCQKEPMTPNNNLCIYFFDSTKNVLVEELLPEEIKELYSQQEQVEYIISRLKDNKSTLLTPLQIGVQMPIENGTTSIDTNKQLVKINFTSEYNELTSQQKIGMRSSIVYSLTQLSFINGVEFYVEQIPLTMATGKKVEAMRASDINTKTLEPSPPTKSFVLNVYFKNNEGKLVKEFHQITASNSSKEEKLVIEELIQGPKNDELSETVPKDLKINTIDILNGVCQLDLSFDVKSKFFQNEEDKTLMIYAIVNSLTELTQIKKVIISIDGQDEIAFTSTINLPATFERSEEYIRQ